MVYRWTDYLPRDATPQNIDYCIERDRKVLGYNMKNYFLFYLKRAIEYFWIVPM